MHYLYKGKEKKRKEKKTTFFVHMTFLCEMILFFGQIFCLLIIELYSIIQEGAVDLRREFLNNYPFLWNDY